MKKSILLIAILIYNINIFSQTGIIIYKVTNTIKNKASNPEMARKINEEINRLSLKLIYNSEKSFFKKEKNIPLYPLEAKSAAIIAKSYNKWHQFNNLERLSTYYTSILNKDYNVDFSYKMRDWELSNEFKIIDGFTCYKATKKEVLRFGSIIEYTAWYAPKIPVPYGPGGYGGLPGLILKLEIGNRFYYMVDKITLNPKKKLKIPELKKGTKISVKEMIRLSREARKVTKD
ncbi:GLPGLI family protein [Polaribacter haliotis]|uniref:GLPGLI family protein n=1 Tax=Polaribacter haliotis TaxID=1888915 RepID=A0A7L8AGZ1_9FLAO|nr:GLPGLI family protein [Polaribacter haliotis]QOD61214.1 GLPGLI family protein [Polaribacter haliotis]